MHRLRFALAAAIACTVTAGSAWAQTYQPSNMGAPQAGVDVQYRYSNPSQSQQFLNAQPQRGATEGQGSSQGTTQGVTRSNANPYQAVIEARGATGPDGQPVEVRNPFTSEAVTGLATATYQLGEMIPAELIYRGIIPNTQNSLPHIAAAQRRGATANRANTLTWIGYQPFSDFSRIFLQTGRAAQYAVRPSPDGRTITIRLHNTQISLRNFYREVVAAGFGRSVNSIDARRGPDGSTEVIIEMAEDTRFEFEQGTSVEDGVTYHYLYMNFDDVD